MNTQSGNSPWLNLPNYSRFKALQADALPLEIKQEDAPVYSTSISHNLMNLKPLKRLDNGRNLSIWKRVGRPKPSAQIRERKEKQLIKLLKPRNAVSLLHEIKPGCTFHIIEDGESLPRTYVAHVEYNNGILATGAGASKNQAKTAAAENVFKSLAGSIFAQNSSDDIKDDTLQNSEENINLIPLASLALYKLFNEWATAKDATALPKVIAPSKHVKKIIPKKELPTNALDIHPSSLLNQMLPGANPFEVRRLDEKVTMGYKINGIVYTGTARNKKDARKEAAKTVLLQFYGLDYENRF